ncbi:MAG TPA: hypothetical protein VFY29_10960, partial [Terriglobia bacterium]|nr:hypothetical protein [Terriglobia bacterium]
IFSFRLVPGEYVVALAPRWLNSYYLKSMTYGDVDLTKSPLTLKPSASDTQVRIVLTRTRPASTTPGVKVSGRITDWKAGGPALALSAILTTMPDRFEVAEVKPRDDGSFEIEGVPPGQYVIGRALSPANRMPVDIRSYLYPSQVIEVGANDVRNLELIFDAQGFPIALSPNVKQAIKGVVEAGDGTIPEFKVEFTEMRVKGGASPPPVTVAGREFSVLLPEGEYRASVSGLPQGYTLKSIASGPFDLTEPFLVTKKGIADRFTGAPIKSGAPGIVIRLNTPSQ